MHDMQDLATLYQSTVREQLATLQQSCDAAMADQAAWPQVCVCVRAIAHDIKGQGTSFDYALMTALGKSLMALMDSAPTIEALPVLQAHLRAMTLVIARAMTGDGGKLGSELLVRLQGLSEKALAADHA